MIGLGLSNVLLSQSNFSFSFEVEPLYTFRSLKLHSYNPVNGEVPSGDILFDKYKEDHNEVESPRWSGAASIIASYYPKWNIGINFGVGYKIVGEQKQISGPGYMIDGKWVSYGDPITYNNSYHYIEVPFGIKYCLKKNDRLQFHVVSGLGLDIKTKTKSDLVYERFDYNYIIGEYVFPSVNSSYELGVQITYKIKGKSYLYIQPSFSRFIFPNVKFQYSDSFKYSSSEDEFNRTYLYGYKYMNVYRYYYYASIKIGYMIKSS